MKTASFMKSVMVSFFLLCGISMNAQTASYYNTKHEVAFSVGAGTNSQLINDIADFSTAFSEIIVVVGMMQHYTDVYFFFLVKELLLRQWRESRFHFSEGK